jgi:catechol 2,3-dioxygenase-like lactoylglutathione lyase family enzyme
MKAFYTAILAPLNYSIFMEHEGVIGYKQPRGGPELWLHSGSTEFKAFDGDLAKRGGHTHLAFEAVSEQQIKQWYAAAIKVKGAIGNGEPGERPHYTKGYFAAYIIDPLGNNIEVMYWQPAWLKAVKAVPYVVTGVMGAALAVGVQLVQSGALDGYIEQANGLMKNRYQ